MPLTLNNRIFRLRGRFLIIYNEKHLSIQDLFISKLKICKFVLLKFSKTQKAFLRMYFLISKSQCHLKTSLHIVNLVSRWNYCHVHNICRLFEGWNLIYLTISVNLKHLTHFNLKLEHLICKKALNFVLLDNDFPDLFTEVQIWYWKPSKFALWRFFNMPKYDCYN